MKLVGDYLKEIRETKGLTLKQAALVTKISARTLRAIESNDKKDLPAKSYLRGFVISYGKFLGAEPTKLSNLIIQEMGSTNPKIKQEIIQKQTWKTIPLINKLKINAKTFTVSGLIALTAFALAVQTLVEKYQKEKVTAPIVSIEPASNIKLANTPQQNIEPKAGLAKAPQKIVEVKNTPATVRKKTYGTINDNNIKELILEAKEDTTIQFKIGNEELKKIKLLGGDFHTIKALSNITLEPGNLDKLNIILNGKKQTLNSNSANKQELVF